MTALSSLIIVPILLPLLVAAVLLLLPGAGRRQLRACINVCATLAGLVVAAGLLVGVDNGGGAGRIEVYLASNWQAPFGIVLVLDRLSALLLVLVGLVSTASALYAEAGWSRAGTYFHPLFQMQLLGLNGAFLTGDLFNLFVFFEVLLAASYGLQLHGSGWLRVRAGMHYIAVNLLASSLFLVGLAVLYGVMGTLSMADIADKLALVAERDRALLHAGAAILAVAFLIKAAIWPLNAWLLPAYTSTSAPVAALFVLMTKVGFYALFRLWTLLFSDDAGASAHFGGEVLLTGGLLTLAFGAIGLLASIRLERIAAFSVIVTAGTLMAALGMKATGLSAAALFYLVSATLSAAMLFLLLDLVRRTRVEGLVRPRETEILPDEDDNLDDDQVPLIGRAFPMSVALLGLAFVACALLVAGLPPLSGFLAKLSLLTAAVRTMDDAPGSAWLLIPLLLLAGLFATISLVRAGIHHFWAKGGRSAPQMKAEEGGAVVFLLAACGLLTVFAEPVFRYTTATAAYLHAPRPYVDAVLGAQARPGPAASAEIEGAPP